MIRPIYFIELVESVSLVNTSLAPKRFVDLTTTLVETEASDLETICPEKSKPGAIEIFIDWPTAAENKSESGTGSNFIQVTARKIFRLMPMWS